MNWHPLIIRIDENRLICALRLIRSNISEVPSPSTFYFKRKKIKKEEEEEEEEEEEDRDEQ
jgi:hypothetical protein